MTLRETLFLKRRVYVYCLLLRLKWAFTLSQGPRGLLGRSFALRYDFCLTATNLLPDTICGV